MPGGRVAVGFYIIIKKNPSVRRITVPLTPRASLSTWQLQEQRVGPKAKINKGFEMLGLACLASPSIKDKGGSQKATHH